MILFQNGYECREKLQIFYNMFFPENDNISVFSNFSYDGKIINVYTYIDYFGDLFFDDLYFEFSDKDEKMKKKTFEASITKSFCHAALKIKKINIPWGVMSGIRPAKNVREFLERGLSKTEVKNTLKSLYEVNDEKIELAMEVAKNEKFLLSQIKENSVSIYIGIPFCPTRCLYCSFISSDVKITGRYIKDFVRLLCEEIKKTKEIIEKKGLFVDNIYIGGGTPTTLDEEELEILLNCVNSYLVSENLNEFTVEAGRPDTITVEKLKIMKENNVNRISINPQTMNDETLKKVGRTHNAELVKKVYEKARDIGFSCINMDLIAGLPDESPEDFYYSLDEVIKLNPENITVHSMCVKRAADLKKKDVELSKASDMNKMLSYTQKRMKETKRVPYYMYRQKNISGNLENVGYAKQGTMSTYNINIMEELQTIIALGGGGVTKIVMGDRIERIFNFKNPDEYIKRFDEILEKKDLILDYLKEA